MALTYLLTYLYSTTALRSVWYGRAGRPRFEQRPSDEQVLENWPTHIAWTVSDLSDPLVAWYRDGSPIFVTRSRQLYDFLVLATRATFNRS